MRVSIRAANRSSEAGFTLPELLISMTVMLLISGAATMALMKMTAAQSTIWSRTQMHSSIRGATEVLQQEVGQAGRVALPNPAKFTGGFIAGTNVQAGISQYIAGSWTGSLAGIFVGEQLVVDAGALRETITVSAVNTISKQITADFKFGHGSNATVQAVGGFATGVVPTSDHVANGSTGYVLKLYGDINADGNMVYVEYTCDTPSSHTPSDPAHHFLYRNMMAWDAGAKPALTPSMVLLGNITDNPKPTPASAIPPCFTYQQVSVNVGSPATTIWFVTDVAITLTVQTQDPLTKIMQNETKALLNVSPRNVVNVWESASDVDAHTDRLQPLPPSLMPPSIATLIQ